MFASKKTQADHVLEDQGYKEATETVDLKLPGIEKLHLRPTNEIAEVLANVIKSQANIVGLHWELGKVIQLVVKN